jgi:hypothetical protein
MMALFAIAELVKRMQFKLMPTFGCADAGAVCAPVLLIVSLSMCQNVPRHSALLGWV